MTGERKKQEREGMDVVRSAFQVRALQTKESN